MNILIGFFSGIISGMGIGGGAILIPSIILLSGISQKLAQGINLLYFIPTAVFSLIVHIKNKNVLFGTAAVIGIFGIIGAILGSLAAMHLENELLQKAFGIFLLAVGIREIYHGVKLQK